MNMFKKLVLLIVGAVLAGGGFLFYTSLPEERTAAITETFEKQKINLESIADDIANSDMVKQAIEKGKQTIMESDQAQTWLRGTVKEYAQQVKGVELSEQDAQELVTALMDLRSFSEEALQEQAAGQEPYTQEQQQRFTEIMNRGDAAFQEHLGVPMNHFLTTLSKSSFKQVIDPEQ